MSSYSLQLLLLKAFLDSLFVLPAAPLEPLLPGQYHPCLPPKLCHRVFGTLALSAAAFRLSSLPATSGEFCPVATFLSWFCTWFCDSLQPCQLYLLVHHLPSDSAHLSLYSMPFLPQPWFAFPVLCGLCFGAHRVPSPVSGRTSAGLSVTPCAGEHGVVWLASTLPLRIHFASSGVSVSPSEGASGSSPKSIFLSHKAQGNLEALHLCSWGGFLVECKQK